MKKLIWRKLTGASKILGVNTFPDMSINLGHPSSHFVFAAGAVLHRVWHGRQCGFAGGEVVPPAPLSKYTIG